MLKMSCKHILYTDQIQGIFITAGLFLETTYVTSQKKKKIKLTYFIQLLLEDFNWEIHEQRIDVLPK